MSSECCYFFGESIPGDARRDIVEIHEMWGDYAFRNVDDLNRKIGVYGDGISCLFYNGRPSGVCESWLISTEGRNEDIPKTERELRDRADRKGNTRVLVTYTIKNTDRPIMIGGTKLTYIYLRHVLNYFKSSEFFITYSPDTQPAQKMHDKHDACYLAGFVLQNARPELVIEGMPAANVRPRGYRWPKNGSLHVSRELNDFLEASKA